MISGRPELTAAEIKAVRDFWAVYDANYDQLWQTLREEVSKYGPADHLKEQAKASRELRRLAVCEGDWEPFLEFLRDAGVTYAQQAVPFYTWVHFLGIFRAAVLPLLYSTYGKNAQRYQAAVNGMNLYHEIVIAVIGHEYVRTKEAAVQEREERFRDLFENANDAVYTADLQGNITAVNRAAERMTGYQREEIVGQNLSRLIAPESLAFSQQMLARKLAGEDVTHYELQALAKDGRRLVFEVSTRLINEDGKPVGIQGIARDVTERKRAEEELRMQQATIQELSTPVLRVTNGLLIVPLIGFIDTRRAKQLTEQLLTGIRDHRAKAVVIDVTGVPVIDSYAAQRLIATAQAARLLGAVVILSGVSRAIAQTLVDIGIRLGNVTTAGDLQSGIEQALRLIHPELKQRSTDDEQDSLLLPPREPHESV